jgi:diaminohydroxyphosphoribosylaminopyrimidine deaminase/5-amino-6-(5-phosphoribosylamino)uracil reductase
LDQNDERFMRRALELSARPLRTSPNPRVGAVLVRGSEVVAEAAHEGAGTPHAEPRVLASADARGATLYVTLEPCVHHGRTPPCAPLVVESGVRRVVAAMEDSDERVRGRGFALLEGAGIEVARGVLEEDARLLNLAYVHHRTTGLPLTTLKLALSLDGRLGAPDGSSRWITGEEARERVHRRRAEADAVLVGSGTVLADDPLLTARAVEALSAGVRIVVDSRGRTPGDAAVFAPPGDTIVATTEDAPHDAHIAWKEAGAEVLVLPGAYGSVDLTALMETLGGRGMQEVVCEGGGGLATALLRAGLVGRLELYHGPVVLGSGGPQVGDIGVRSMPEATRWRCVDVRRLGDDVLAVYVPGGH